LEDLVLFEILDLLDLFDPGVSFKDFGELGGDNRVVKSNVRCVLDKMLLAGESLKLKLDAPARDNGEVEPGEDNGEVDKLEPRDAEARRGELAEIRKREGFRGVKGDAIANPLLGNLE
tara:strand:+ start:180 stop:533 length:354 start_codon:yes stop_codon:yes gene_type:complete